MMVERRAIRQEEAEVLRAAIEKAALVSISPEVLSSIPQLTIVGRCECGCPSIHFDDRSPLKSTVLAHGVGKTPAGGSVGILVWGRPDAITGLEIYDLGAGDEDLRLPVPDSIEAWPPGR